MPDSTLPQIKHIVFLMLENRSLDNLLGWLYADGATPNFWPPGRRQPYDGLNTGTYYQPWSSSVQYPVVPLPDEHAKEAVPAWDPYEEMYTSFSWNGVLNQMFGNENPIGGMPTSGTPGMQGFYQDYYTYKMVEWEGKDILWTYTPDQLKVMNALARRYGVSDAWFCSVPTQTNPNRAFSLIGSSEHRENNSHYNAVEQFDKDTIFNVLGAKVTWGLYYNDLWQTPKGSKTKQCYTEYTFPRISAAKNGEIATLDRFFTLARSGSLPAFTYLEPKWGYGYNSSREFVVQGWDYHPPTLVGPGENFLLSVYNALRYSKKWNETLFIVTFDEHGGTFDHVAPSWTATNPGDKNGKQGFNFKLFGARVPTLLISPYIPQSTVFRAMGGIPFDHTSFIKTLLGWAGIDFRIAHFGKRMPQAPTFEGVLTDKIVNNADLSDIEAPLYKPLPNDISELFEGVSFASVRWILRRGSTLEEIKAEIARYHANHLAYEAEVEAGVP